MVEAELYAAVSHQRVQLLEGALCHGPSRTTQRLFQLDETFLVTSHSNGSIWGWAGHFQVRFIMAKKEWQGKENVAEAVKAFVDLKGLAEIDATEKPEENANPN